MAAADTVVIPSLGEGFSLVILEALASGLPVFTTRVGGSEVITGIDGTVCESVEDVVRVAISSPLSDGDPAERIHRARRNETIVSVDTVADEFLAIYKHALGRVPPLTSDIIDLRHSELNNVRAGARVTRNWGA